MKESIESTNQPEESQTSKKTIIIIVIAILIGTNGLLLKQFFENWNNRKAEAHRQEILNTPRTYRLNYNGKTVEITGVKSNINNTVTFKDKDSLDVFSISSAIPFTIELINSPKGIVSK